MKIINLTTHSIEVDGVTYLSQDLPARVYEEFVGVGKILGHSVVASILGDVEDLPDATDKTYLIVSRQVFDECPFREDLLTQVDSVRDGHGRIIGCKKFIGRKKNNVSIDS